ncbi:MAG: D-glycerate dehydrogenase [Candidatus Lokiarchaeota archaeon]|nr:D-glycerate dehydrogenase [Candidatus Lokiarchaeota archaeon]
MYKILMTRELPYENFDLFGEEFKFFINRGKKLTRNQLLNKVKGMNGIISTLRNNIGAEVIESAGSNLKVISNYAVGYDNINVKEATKYQIFVTNTPSVLTETTADHAWALLMSASRRVVEAHNYILNGKWKDWHPLFFAGRDIHGKTLGIIGLGRIGTAIARKSLGFNMKLLYHSRTRKPELEKELNITYRELNDVLEQSDFIMLSVPLIPKTKHLIGKKELGLMKKSAFLINISRGPVIDEKALISVLKHNKIAGAGLDVFTSEPINPNNPLLKLKNIVITPHIGSATIETRTMMAKVALENVYHVLKGDYHKANIVNSKKLLNI